MLRSDRGSAGNDGVGRAESRPSRIGLISLDMKQMGERSAGKPHAAFDVAGAGNVARSRYLGRSRRASPRPYRLTAWPWADFGFWHKEGCDVRVVSVMGYKAAIHRQNLLVRY